MKRERNKSDKDDLKIAVEDFNCKIYYCKLIEYERKRRTTETEYKDKKSKASF